MGGPDRSAATAGRAQSLALSALVRLTGSVGAASFAPWIHAHGRKLGLGVQILSQTDARVEVAVSGQPALIEAMALACSLGPKEVWVEEVEQTQPADHKVVDLG